MLFSCQYRLLWPPVARLTIIFFVGYMASCTTDHRVAWPERKGKIHLTLNFSYIFRIRKFQFEVTIQDNVIYNPSVDKW
jgi:hypothetical protein